jgi:membrane fusion protein (multidrug efflux system)
MPPLPVTTVVAESRDVALTGEWVGTLDGYVNAQIQPQVSGYLVRQTYREGQPVSKGQVLFEIDPRPLEAALAQAQGQMKQAQGQVEQAKGQVGQAQAQLGLAQINVNRDAPLAAQHAIAESQLDNDKQGVLQQQASVASAQASVAAAQAQVAAAQAAVDTAKLNLGFTHVRSLIGGVAGQATTQVGSLVSPQSVLTSVSTLDPIKVFFSISDSEYLALAARGGQGGSDLLRSSANLPLSLTLSDGTLYPHTGRIIFVDRQVNQQTGAIRIAAAFPNPGNLLRPGAFARVKANTGTLHDVILVPQSAVSELQGIEQVAIAGSDGKVHMINVELGPQSGVNWVIKSGLRPGTQVITDQLQKLREGMPVHPTATTQQISQQGTPGLGTTQSVGR